MKIALFCHPFFMRSQSMPRFAKMLQEAFKSRGYEVELLSPKPWLHRFINGDRFGKWAGYVDQYIFFPIRVRRSLAYFPADTLFVFCDQALGPWVPLVANRPHVIHCHDFLALRSAKGEFPSNPVKWSGRVYQRFIRNGFSRGHNFISVSHSTKAQLDALLPSAPVVSKVVHNGLNYDFVPMPPLQAGQIIRHLSADDCEGGMLVHVGGNAWYKNRLGVLRIYAAYCTHCADPLPIWMVGDAPTNQLREMAAAIPGNGKVIFLSGLPNEQVNAIYSVARALIFPSIAEGFGWPIAEAMACGCPVLTTGEAPMTEVGGPNAVYIPVMPQAAVEINSWASKAAGSLLELLHRTDEEKLKNRAASLAYVQKFSAEKAIDAYEKIYHSVINHHP